MKGGQFSLSAKPLNPYLIISPSAVDRGEKIGSNPAFLSANTLRGLGHPEKPMKAIRAHCVACSGGSYSEANKCTAMGCPLWAFRMGRNPFHARAKLRTDPFSKEKPAAAATLQVSDLKNTDSYEGDLLNDQ